MKSKMISGLDLTCSLVLILFGSLHTGMTLLVEKPLDLDTVMFAGAGISFMLLGGINLYRRKSSDRWFRNFTIISNIFLFSYLMVVAFIFNDLRVLVVGIAILLLVIISFQKTGPSNGHRILSKNTPE